MLYKCVVFAGHRRQKIGPRAERVNCCRPRLCEIACIVQTKSLFKLTLWLVGLAQRLQEKILFASVPLRTRLVV